MLKTYRMIDKHLYFKYKGIQLLFTLTNPLLLVVFFNLLALICFFLTPSELMLSFASENKYISFHSGIIYILFLIAFSLGCLITPKENKILIFEIPREKLQVIRPLIKISAFGTFVLSIIGYFFWFKHLLLKPHELIYMYISHGAYFTRMLLKQNMVSGLTTLTQFGILSAILFYILFLVSSQRRYIIPIGIILFLALLRALVFSERLAMLEIMIPVIFIYLRFHPEKIFRVLVTGLIVFALLWSSELLRSFMSPKYYLRYEPIEFLGYRFLMYFSTTVNNAFLIFDKYHPYQDFMPNLLKFYYKLLGTKDLMSYKEFEYLLMTFGNPEYNNQSFFGELYFDWGILGIIISFIYGVILKILYNHYKKSSLLGIFLYPICLTFLFQSYRINYLTNSRVIYPIIGLLFLYLICIFKVKIKYNNECKDI